MLTLLAGMEHQSDAEYHLGMYTDEVVVWQLGELREPQAVERLRRIASFESTAPGSCPFGRTRHELVRLAREALAKIEGKRS